MLELVATLVVFLTCVPAREDSTGKLFIKAVTGGLLIWFSFPVIFVLAGVAITHILCYYRKRHLIPHLIVFTVWALSFGINFFLFVKSGTKDQFLLTFWKYHFMPLSPEIFRWGARLVYQTLNIPLGLSYSLIAVLALFAGIYSIWRRSRILSALCIFPCLLALIASALHLYPFHGRFLLFLVPIFLLWIAVGIMYCYDHLSHSANYAKIKILVLILLLAPPMVQAMYYLVYPDRFYYITRQEIRPVIQQMLKYHQAGDDIFVHQLATAQFRYYDKLLGITQQFDQANWVRPDSTATKPNVSQVIVQIFNASNLPEVSDHYMNKRSWFLFCRDKHDEEKHSLTFLNGNFRLLSKHKATRASIYLYQRR